MTTITLAKPLTGHGKTVTTVEVREPTGREFLELGEPRSLVKAAGGALVFADNDSAIQSYVEKCIEGDALLVIGQASLVDMMKIKKAVLDFFTAANMASAANAS
jgi:hypothetical protein